MSLRLPRLSSPRFHRLLLAALCSLPLAGGACSDDSSGDDAAVADYTVEVTAINDTASSEPIALRCDSTLAVQVAITASDPSVPFLIKPAYACGTSVRCGYVHIEALDADDALLASVDTATLAGVLTLPSADVVPVRIRATLLSGVDREPIENPHAVDPSATIEPTFEPASATCDVAGEGDGGAGGSPGAGGAAQGGAAQGGAAQAGAPSGGGDGGVPSAGAAGAAQGGAAQGGAAQGGAAQGDGGAAGAP